VEVGASEVLTKCLIAKGLPLARTAREGPPEGETRTQTKVCISAPFWISECHGTVGLCWWWGKR
jgi:hypothetical protein